MARERRYEQALKAASQWHKTGTDTVKAVVECIFPELRESKDENMLLSIINDAEQGTLLCREQIDWLKSLKTQKHWKPNEDQLRVLKIAIRDYGNSHERNVLESLYNNLKQF